MGNPRKDRSACLVCSKETYRAGYKYCSNKCQGEYEYWVYIREWKEGILTGLAKTGVVTKPVKRYLREKFGNKCYLCGWCEVNPRSGLVPLVADHIDGNWRNNIENNLRLVCPNCDSLSPTYAALNKGNGRSNRAVSNRYKEARYMRNNL